jgi:hypothetical protein
LVITETSENGDFAHHVARAGVRCGEARRDTRPDGPEIDELRRCVEDGAVHAIALEQRFGMDGRR